MVKDFIGTVVSEEEVATSLGFKDVIELRRFHTEQGIQILELEHKLSQSEQDAERFRWHGQRMQKVLEKIEPVLEGFEQTEEISNLLLALKVVCGKEADWQGKIRKWLD